MAEKRMFSKSVIDSDAFLSMPLSTQALYFHLAMRADDDGFIDNPRKIMRMICATEDDMKVLITKQYVLAFDTGLIVIKHWRLHNYIRKDRYKETLYTAEKKQLAIDENGAYTPIQNALPANQNSAVKDGCQVVDQRLTDGQPMVAKRLTQYRLDKNSIDKNSISIEGVQGEAETQEVELKSDLPAQHDTKKINQANNHTEPVPKKPPDKRKRFVKPTVYEVAAYCKERDNSIDAQAFYDYYESKGWLVGKSPMKDWKAAVRNWERNDYSSGRKKQQSTSGSWSNKKNETEPTLEEQLRGFAKMFNMTVDEYVQSQYGMTLEEYKKKYQERYG